MTGKSEKFFKFEIIKTMSEKKNKTKTITLVSKRAEPQIKENVKVKEKFSKEDISNMLKDYKEIRKSDLEKVPLRIGIKYEDQERFKYGGVLIAVESDKIKILHRGRPFSVIRKNLKRVWIQDTEKRDREREQEEKDHDEGLTLLELYREGRVTISKSEKEREVREELWKGYKESRVKMYRSKKEKETSEKVYEAYREGKVKVVR